MTRVSCYTNAPRSPLPRRAACFTSHRAARERFLLRRKRGGDFSDGRLLINPKTPPPIEKGACQRRLWRFFFPPSPKSRKSSSFDFFSKDKNNVLTKMTTTTTTPKSFFSHFFHSLLFSNTPRNFIFFAPWGLLSDSFVSLSLSLSLSFSFRFGESSSFIGTKFVLRAVETTTTTEEERCSTTLGRRCVSLSLSFFFFARPRVTAGFIFISLASSLNRHDGAKNGVTNCSSSRINNRRENRPRTWKSFHPDRSSC